MMTIKELENNLWSLQVIPPVNAVDESICLWITLCRDESNKPVTRTWLLPTAILGLASLCPPLVERYRCIGYY
jgi:hypothetical protein